MRAEGIERLRGQIGPDENEENQELTECPNCSEGVSRDEFVTAVTNLRSLLALARRDLKAGRVEEAAARVEVLEVVLRGLAQ